MRWCYALLLAVLLLPSSAQSRPSRQYFPGPLRVTQYLDCCITASGAHVYYGEAAGPPWMRFGTIVVVPGLGRFTILDRGGAVQGCCHIDVWVPRCPFPGIKDYYRNAWWR